MNAPLRSLKPLKPQPEWTLSLTARHDGMKHDDRVRLLLSAAGVEETQELAVAALEVIEERMRVNVGLVAENAKLRKLLRG